jgi:ketosteroid isomerase-like protein
MDSAAANTFVANWLRAWNDHDLEPILNHFADDVVFTSPVAGQLVPGSDGVIQGRTALRAYWQEGLRRIPDLRFEVVGVYLGVDTLVINYRNQRGGLVSEVLTFGGRLVTAGHATYADAGGNPAGASSDESDE